MTTARRCLAALTLVAIGMALAARVAGPTAEHVPAMSSPASGQADRSVVADSLLASLPADHATVRHSTKDAGPGVVLLFAALGIAVLVVARRPRWFGGVDHVSASAVVRLRFSRPLRGPPHLLFG
ncbi:MAG: hypothetical protein JOY57_09560 [Actinobacteria bacterium]|nr:hypothetical protein [Actinomycetota bacterium]